MEFSEDVDLPEHSHASQMGIVLEGQIDLIIDDVKNIYQKGAPFVYAMVFLEKISMSIKKKLNLK